MKSRCAPGRRRDRAGSRRYATQQINQAYAVLLSSQLQAYCRDLHTEGVRHLVGAITPASFRPVLEREYLWNRRIDRGNPNPGNLGADFTRLGIDLWSDALAADGRNAPRRRMLEELSGMATPLRTQDFTGITLGSRPVLHLSQVQSWRKACDGLGSVLRSGRQGSCATRHRDSALVRGREGAMNDWVMARWLAKHPGPNKVGDRVRFQFGARTVEGVIVEDRRNLGGGGKRLYGIRWPLTEWEEGYVELTPDEFEVVAEAPPAGDNGKPE